MVVTKHTYEIIVLCIVVHLYLCVGIMADIPMKSDGKKLAILANIYDSDYDESEETWLENVLRDIAYYLRNHKFNEWDRRYYINKPAQNLFGFYTAFPTPSLRSLHWEVHKHCHKDFFKCITYLHSVIQTAPFTRKDDITTSLNRRLITGNITLLQMQNNDCKKALLYSEKTGLPFDGPKERFIWRTSASYYMCWYTMKENPALSMLGESCDNFADCLDPTYGNRNRDPRSNDKLSFACAIYSFCPDPCCPLKHIYERSECHNDKLNPCYMENAYNNELEHTRCIFNRRNNQNFEQMIENKWNVSCHCQQEGFMWDSQFGMCVDNNECTAKQHHCDMKTEDCLNLPGTFQCVCKWGYRYDKAKKKCIEQNFVFVKVDANEKPFDLWEILNTFFEYIS